MRLLSNKFTEIAVLGPILVFLMVSGYFFFISYNEYQRAQNDLNNLEYYNKLNTVLNDLGKEQALAAIHFGTHGKADYAPLKAQWKKSDTNIESLKEFTQTNSSYQNRTSFLLQMLKKMQQDRSEVSLLNRNYIDVDLGKYATPAKNTIIKLMSTIQNENNSSADSTLIKVYIDLAVTRDNISEESALVSFFVSRATTIRSRELEIWDKLIGKNFELSYKDLLEPQLEVELNKIFEEGNYHKIAKEHQDARISVLFGSDSGYFMINELNRWDRLSQKYTLLFNQTQNEIIKFISNNIETQMLSSKKIMNLAIAVMITLLVLALIVRMIFANMASDAKRLEKVVENLIDPQIKEEYNLPKMLAQNDKTQIYQFLEKTILDAKESKKIAEDANRIKSLFLANMSHEIRTPLNGVMGFTELLRTSELNQEQEEFVQIIQKSSENLLSVINDILDLSKIESEKVEIEAIGFDPIVEFESGIESYGAKAAEKDIYLGLYIDPQLANYQLKGDPTRIKQVLVNLMSNAIKFTPLDGNVNVSIEIVEHFDDELDVKFVVKDSGIGISPEQQGKIFEAFSQEDSGTNRQYGGTGLGLTISNKLVGLMGSKLELESKKNHGSSFFFTLKMKSVLARTTSQEFNNLHALYYLPNSQEITTDDETIEKYLQALSSQSGICRNYNEVVDSKIDILFVKYSAIELEELKRLLELNIKVVLLTTVYSKEEINKHNLDLFKMLYTPINFSKIKSSFMLLKGEEQIKPQEEVERFKDLKILVAEDNTMNQKLIKRVLEDMGIEVTIVKNGEEAFKERTIGTYDMILMDIQMPIMSGVESTHAILKYEKENNLPHIPIVALTANALKGDREKYLAEGMDDYTTKPIQIHRVQEMLHSYFAQKVETELQEELKAQDIPKYTDILLAKESKQDRMIFNVLLKKIGYSVDVAQNLDNFKELLRTKHYRYILLDKHLPTLQEDYEIDKLLHDSKVKTILFVEDVRLATSRDHKKYTMIAPNVPNANLLRTLILKLHEK
ncbi:MAG: ATP-binding protein [Campylobacterota bacterium]|nr:ATP-binding protein [Campylobacterota bacterium]